MFTECLRDPLSPITVTVYVPDGVRLENSMLTKVELPLPGDMVTLPGRPMKAWTADDEDMAEKETVPEKLPVLLTKMIGERYHVSE